MNIADEYRGQPCSCTTALAVMLRADHDKGVSTKLSLQDAVNVAKGMLHDDPSLHECEHEQHD